MRWRDLFLLFVVFASAFAKADNIWWPSEVSVHIPDFVAKASFVCKGEVTSAPELRTIDGPLPRLTGLAMVRIDRCFKGKLDGFIPVAVDEYRPGGGWGGGGGLFAPAKGEYLLLFFSKKDDRYEVVPDYRGGLPVSRLKSAIADGSDPLINLENDFKAGLSDPDPEVVLKSIGWLGRLKHLRSTTELHALLKKADPLQRVYLWETLLTVGDSSVVADVANYLDQNPPEHRPLFLPKDRLVQMRGRVFWAFCNLRDPAVVPYLEHFVQSPDSHTRLYAIMGLREIGSLSSAPVFLRALDDHHEDIDFIAMQSLFELAGGGAMDWYTGNFFDDPALYAARCRQWWAAEGEAKAKARAVAGTGVQTR